MLGKRKRETTVFKRAPTSATVDDVSSHSSGDVVTVGNTSDLFRQHFEKTFDPLPTSVLTTSILKNQHPDITESDAENDANGNSNVEKANSDWSGISDADGDTSEVEIVEHASTLQTNESDPIDKIFQKTFMTSKPPKELHTNPGANKTPTSQDEDEVTNFKHDLDLQRLLRESHLLEQKNKHSKNGGQRHKATDMRLQSLGSRASLFSQESMPMSHRRGILAKASQRDAHRRREARESGIVLEHQSKQKSSIGSRRDRGVDVPVVGTFRHGTLQLSRKDVASIQGSRRAGSKKAR